MTQAPKTLHETDNYKCLRPGMDGGPIAAYFHISEDFMEMARERLNNASLAQTGFYRYSVAMFCLGHAFELLYKSLLLIGEKKVRGHRFAALYGEIDQERRDALKSIIVQNGWLSPDDFHTFMLDTIDHVNRKYFEKISMLDMLESETSGTMDHQLWPGLLRLWEEIRTYVASEIWINPDLPVDDPVLKGLRLTTGTVTFRGGRS